MKKIFTVVAFTAIIFIGCNSQEQKEPEKKYSSQEQKEPEKINFYGINMLDKVDLNNFVYKQDDNRTKTKEYESKAKDKLFDKFTLSTDKNDKILAITLVKNIEPFKNPYDFANSLIPDLEKKYGSFKCEKEESIGIMVSENCITEYKKNIIQLNLFVFGNIRSVSLRYINPEYLNYDSTLKEMVDKIQMKSKL